MHHLEKRSNIESSKAFQRLSEKTQVFFPQSGREQVVKNRMSHSYEVATSAQMMGEVISEDINLKVDYKNSLHNISLLHDIGHPPFGHSGADFIDKFIKYKGLEEGFDDNNNNLEIIEKNGIFIDDYDFASIIKYPDRLYQSQSKFLKLLQKAIDCDMDYFSKAFNISDKPSRTVACSIMDEADRNSYITSDLADFFTLSDNFDEFEHFFNNIFCFSNQALIKDLNKSLYEAYKEKDKNKIKRSFNLLKNRFNQNFSLNSNLNLVSKNDELYEYRELLGKLSFECFISTPYFKEVRKNNIKALSHFSNCVFEDKFYPSKSYRDIIENSTEKNTKLQAIRNMIGEVSDWYIVNLNNV